jgi:hypothetical protein
MALIVKEKRSTGISISGSEDESTGKQTVKQSVTTTYWVTATGYSDPRYITDAEVACAAGLPVVNSTTWYSSISGVGLPSAVCRSKSVKRLSDNGFVFEVECEFETPSLEGEDCAGVPPATVDDLLPSVQSQISSYERVLYSDKNGEQCWKLPGTKTPFSSPITETIPIFSLTITQYEASISFEDQIARSYKTNSDTYRAKGPGLWMIGAVSATNQTVQLAGGPTTVAKVTYPVTLSERFYYPPGVSPTPANAVTYGWDKIQPLVDTMRMTAPPVAKLVPMTDAESGNVRAGYIDLNGEERVVTEGSDDDRPDYLRFETQGSIAFASFLQA